MSLTAFAARTPVASHDLPLTLMTLDDWAVARIKGPDAEKYLQGQVTADVTQLSPSQHVLCAHCDAKGKMWSNLRLFHDTEGFAWILRRSVRDNQLTELKKYAVFSKVTIAADEQSTLLGLAGQGARAALASLFEQLPDAQNTVVQDGDNALLWFSTPEERFLLVLTPACAEEVVEKLGKQAQCNDSQQWLALDIEAGLPIIDSANSDQLLPQATNLQALEGISFKKGCYTGQEMVARAKFRGANKRALWSFAGQASRVPEAGEDLELQLGANWRRTGTVLAAVQLADDQVWMQAVLNNDLDENTVVRVRDDETGTLKIMPLPYSLTEH